MFCKYCGNELRETYKFCNKCGKAVDRITEKTTEKVVEKKVENQQKDSLRETQVSVRKSIEGKNDDNKQGSKTRENVFRFLLYVIIGLFIIATISDLNERNDNASNSVTTTYVYSECEGGYGPDPKEYSGTITLEKKEGSTSYSGTYTGNNLASFADEESNISFSFGLYEDKIKDGRIYYDCQYGRTEHWFDYEWMMSEDKSEIIIYRDNFLGTCRLKFKKQP